MKHSAKVKAQRAYVTRRNDADNARFVQREAEIIALQNGDTAEAARRRYAEQKLASKQRKTPIDAYLLPEWLLRDLGGPRDVVAALIKDRSLTAALGRVALILREHVEGVSIDIQGNGDFGVFIQGGEQSGMESVCDKRAFGRHAWSLTLEACDPRARKAVERSIMGLCGMAQAYRLIGGDTTKATKIFKQNMRSGLSAAAAYLGA